MTKSLYRAASFLFATGFVLCLNAPVSAWADCRAGTSTYSEGMRICQEGERLQCINSRWEVVDSCAGSAAPPRPPATSTRPRLYIAITGGRYGAGEIWARLVEWLEDKCGEDARTCRVKIDNFTFGRDPVPGKPKSWRVDYACENADGDQVGDIKSVHGNEGDTASLSCR